jgi:hypothetical protein
VACLIVEAQIGFAARNEAGPIPVIFDQEAGSNFAIKNKGIVIITADKSIKFVFH